MTSTPRWSSWVGLLVVSLGLSWGGRWILGQEVAAPEKAKPAAKPAATVEAAEKPATPTSPEAKPASPVPPEAKPATPTSPEPKPAASPNPAVPAAPSAAPGPTRPLAPGALKTVDAMRQVEETVSRHDLVEVLAVNPKLDWAKEVVFRREIWALQFRFKPMRMIDVDLPQPSGRMQRKQIWYIVYQVTNAGKCMRPVPAKDSQEGAFDVEYVDKPVRFVPSFLLHSEQLDKWYPDRVIPAAIGPIQMREDPNRPLLNSIEIVREIPVGETVWGVATWEDIDPRTDRFSVYVAGLTNAYRWSDEPGKYKPGAPVGTGRHLQKKTLKLNFWRPGDEFSPKEREIRFGVPGGVDYEWVYR